MIIVVGFDYYDFCCEIVVNLVIEIGEINLWVCIVEFFWICCIEI